jgi:hypothetical protein
VSKSRIDASLEGLLASTPPRITVEWGQRADGAPGAPVRVYRLVAAQRLGILSLISPMWNGRKCLSRR